MATPFSCVQLALEESPLNEATKSLGTTPNRISTVKRYLPIQSAGPALAPAHLDRSDELRGILGAFSQLIETYNPAASISVRTYLNDLPFLLACSGMLDTITAGDGSAVKDPDNVSIPVGATRHVFTKKSGITPQTLQALFCYVPNTVFLQENGLAVSSLSINALGEISAGLDGLFLDRVADPNLTPTFDSPSIVHARRGDMTVTWLGGSGTPDDFTLSIASPVNRRRSMNLATPSYYADILEFGDQQTYLTGTLPLSTFKTADWDSLKSSGVFAATVKWKLPITIGATGYNYRMWIEIPSCQLLDMPPDPLANRQRFGASQSWFASWDSIAGYDYKITIVNAVTAIATYV